MPIKKKSTQGRRNFREKMAEGFSGYNLDKIADYDSRRSEWRRLRKKRKSGFPSSKNTGRGKEKPELNGKQREPLPLGGEFRHRSLGGYYRASPEEECLLTKEEKRVSRGSRVGRGERKTTEVSNGVRNMTQR